MSFISEICKTFRIIANQFSNALNTMNTTYNERIDVVGKVSYCGQETKIQKVLQFRSP